MKNKNEVKAYMIAEYTDHIDDCGELNLTGLAEDAADHFNLYEDDIEFHIPETVFELAFDVEQELFDAGTLNY